MKYLENIISVPIPDDKFEEVDVIKFKINYMWGKKSTIRIAVNGILTNQKINLAQFRDGYKGKILLAIMEYVERNKERDPIYPCHKFISITQLATRYPNVMSNVIQHLLPINKTDDRNFCSELKTKLI